MNALEQVDELKAQAIKILLEERERIDAELKRLGYGQDCAPRQKRRGRPPKVAQAVSEDGRQSQPQTGYPSEAGSSSPTD